jgi:hypothetical protein
LIPSRDQAGVGQDPRGVLHSPRIIQIGHDHLGRPASNTDVVTITGKSYRLRNKIEVAAIESDGDSKPAKTHAGKTALTRTAKASTTETVDEKHTVDA